MRVEYTFTPGCDENGQMNMHTPVAVYNFSI